jgi:hypothetical protein
MANKFLRSVAVAEVLGGLSGFLGQVAIRGKGPYDVSPSSPEWRNWYTHQTQNLARFTPHVGSSPTSGTKDHKALLEELALTRMPVISIDQPR